MQVKDTSVYATSLAGSFWWLVDQAYRYGPSWSLVPPILLALASLIGAVNSFLDGRQQRRQREAELRTSKFLAGIKNMRPLDPEAK